MHSIYVLHGYQYLNEFSSKFGKYFGLIK